MDEQGIAERLVSLGMNRYEARVYIALLSQPQMRASEIAKRARVPQQKVYDALYELCDKGFCQVVSSEVKQFRAVEPGPAINAYLNGMREVYERNIRARQELATGILSPLEAAYCEGRKLSESGFIHIMKGRNQIGEWFVKFMRSTTREYLGISKPPYIMSRPDMFEHLKRLSGLGVDTRMIFQRDKSLALIDEFLAAIRCLPGLSVRYLPLAPMKLALFDEARGIMTLGDSEASTQELTGLVFERPDLSRSLKNVFDEYWSSGTLEA